MYGVAPFPHQGVGSLRAIGAESSPFLLHPVREWGLRMKKTVLLLVSMALVLPAGGVALAANIKGDGSDNMLTGTELRDTLNPFGGNDTV